jgi:hypothetical protein
MTADYSCRTSNATADANSFNGLVMAAPGAGMSFDRQVQASIQHTRSAACGMLTAAPNGLISKLEQLSGLTLSTEQQSAACQLACSLPDNARLIDFVNGSFPHAVTEAGLPKSISHSLAPVSAALARHLAVAIETPLRGECLQ